MFQEKAEQAIEPVPDAYNITLVMNTAYTADTDCMKCLADRWIVTLFTKEPFCLGERSGGILQHGDEGQETLVYDIVIQLFLHIWIK